MLKWPVPHVLHFNDTALIGTEEREIVHLRAFVRVFKCEGDADYHLELADSRAANARRIIAEAPDSDSTVRAQLEALMGGEPSKKGKPLDGAAAAPIEIWGWRFLDLDHQSALKDKNGKRRTMAALKAGHGHGSTSVRTLWEVHPILRVQRWTP